MARTNFTQYPSPNPKYPFIGDNYKKHGEVAGYVYYPYNDQYYVDKKAQQSYLENTGQIEKPKTQPGLLATLGTLGAVSAVGALGKDVGGSLFGGGTTAPTAATAGLNAPVAEATTQGAGLFGLGGQAAAPVAETAPEAVASGLNGGTVLADGSTVGAPGMFSGVASNLASLGGLAGTGVAAGILGGGLLSAKGAKDIYQGNDTKGLEGWGGRAQLGILTGGLSELTRPFFKKSQTEVEDKRLADLKAKGLLDPSFQINKESRSRAEQLKDLQKNGVVDEKKKKWLETGDVQYLTGQDVQGYAALLEKNPNDMQARIKDGDDAIKAGALKAHHGTVDVDWDKLNAWRQAQSQKPANQPVAPKTNQPLPSPQIQQTTGKGLLGAFR